MYPSTAFSGEPKKTINKYKKRWRREGLYMSLFLYVPGLGPDNNDVERMNRTFKCTINDGGGGGNKSKLGMHVNSILFTILATTKAHQNTIRIVSLITLPYGDAAAHGMGLMRC